MELTLDIASELYPLAEGDVFSLLVARSLKPDDADEDMDTAADGETRKIKRDAWRAEDQGLANDYDYVMHGKVYKFDDSAQGDNMTTAYISYGGLLMALRGSYRHLANVVVGENVFLLMRK
jgi:DNA-directed RNA polymerase I, II, and III subunit RPABC3